MFRTALLILSGNATASLLLLVRNLVVARLIPVEDYGIAATFAVVMAMVEMASAFGLQQQIVQSKDGDDPRFQAGLQGFQVLRGILAGAVLFLIAGPMARFLGIPEVIWAYQVLALVPVIKAFEHFDIHRFNRQMRFWPMILTGAVPALLSLLLVWPLAMWLGDWRVLLYAILAQMSLLAITSHLVAERPYRLVFDRLIMGGSLRFGWPILVNSVLMFLVFQGDKLIVGRALGMEALAIFAMGMTLTLTPTLVIAKSEQNFFLPKLSTAEVGLDRFAQLAKTAMQTSLVSGLLLVMVVILVGNPLVHFLLGPKYQSLIPLLTWFAIMQALRTFKVGCTVIALSKGHTSNAMIANSFRLMALPAAWYVATNGWDLLWIVGAAIAGEFLAYLVSVTLAHRCLELQLRDMLLPILGAFAVLIVASGHTLLSGTVGYPIVCGTLAVCTMFLLSTVAMTELRRYVARKLIA